ncbi:MAG TPA: AMP-binding protein [Chitinophagaceae bacterium]|nr:AMP-binding protein [Chitinophagaceae bacterium]
MDYKSPLEMLYYWETTTPGKVYLRQPINNEWHNWTWKQTGEEVRKMAAAIRDMQLPANSNIAMISKNCAHWIICDLAIMMSGHTSVPLYPNLSANVIRQILEHSNSKLLFVGKLDDWPSMKPGVPEELKCISLPFCSNPGCETWDDIIGKHPPIKENIFRNPDELATIIYTSGTTGLPKGVMHTFKNFSFVASNAIQHLGFKHTDRFFSYLPLSHIAERLLVETISLYVGAQVSFAESLQTFPKNLFEAKPTVFLGVHRIWSKFQQGILKKISQKKLNILLKIPFVSGLIKKKMRTGLGLADATNILTGAAPTPVTLIKWFESLGINIQEAYAMTENCCYSHVSVSNKIKIGFTGQPLPNCEVKLGDNNEILIKHEAMMVGYYKEPELSSQSFSTDGFLRTGDEGYIDEEGFLKITGRVKDIFKSAKGKYVSPTPIEMKICGNNDLAQVCVVGTGLPQPIALITLSENGKKKTKEAIESGLNEMLTSINPTLDAHERISKIVVLPEEWTVENGLLTPSFKIKRNEVEKKYSTNYEEWNSREGYLIFEN